jgi:hypothetical protein
MEYVRDNLFFRPNSHLKLGQAIYGHKHNFSHVSVLKKGWFLIRARYDGKEVIRQFATPEYVEVRRLLQKYEPNKVMRPIRFADTIHALTDEEHNDLHIEEPTQPRFNITFISKRAPVPEGGEVIHFRPFVISDPLIKAGVEHEIIALSDDAEFVCVYSHRTPQGEVSEFPTGWEPAYL